MRRTLGCPGRPAYHALRWRQGQGTESLLRILCVRWLPPGGGLERGSTYAKTCWVRHAGLFGIKIALHIHVFEAKSARKGDNGLVR